MVRDRILIVIILSLTLLSGCYMPQQDAVSRQETGYMLVQYGGYIYRIGGISEDGTLSNEIFRSEIILNDDTVSFGAWDKESLSLPEPRAYGAALAAGGYLYVLGGEDSLGVTDSVLVTKIREDGSLGFGTEIRYWIDEEISLPAGRSHMSAEFFDGRIFLIGGETAEGPEETIIQAKIHSGASGQVGHWYESPERLPAGMTDCATAVTDSRLFICGGESQGGSLVDALSYDIGMYGRLSDKDVLADLPEGRYLPVMTASGHTVVLGGGYTAVPSDAQKGYILHDAGWELMPEAFPVTGLFSGGADGRLVGIGTGSGYEPVLVTVAAGISPTQPLVTPGSGYARADEEILIEQRPGDTLVYAADPPDDTILDLEADHFPGSIPITGSSRYLFRNISTYGSSAISKTTYVTKSIPLFIGIDGRLTIQPPGESELHTLDISSTEAWYSLRLYVPKTVSMNWADASDSSEYQSQASIALYEEDYFTEVIDTSGYPIASTPALVTDAREDHRSWEVGLTPGTYYLHVKDTDGLVGGSIGFSISEVEE